jgi:hypothetical protein
MTEESKTALAEHVDAIESAYEFMLAYAAQGRDGGGGDAVVQVRQFMNGMDAALAGIGSDAASCLADEAGNIQDYMQKFLEVLKDDAEKSRAIVRFVLEQQRISSQLVDSLNASIHLRAMLTDLFLLDEVLKIR